MVARVKLSEGFLGIFDKTRAQRSKSDGLRSIISPRVQCGP